MYQCLVCFEFCRRCLYLCFDLCFKLVLIMPYKYSTEQRSWLLKEYVKTRSPTAVQRNWTARYGSTAPAKTTINSIFHKFNATGSVLDAPKTGRKKSVRTEENEQLVAQSLVDNPQNSIRRISVQLEISKSSVQGVLKSIGWKPYRPQLTRF